MVCPEIYIKSVSGFINSERERHGGCGLVGLVLLVLLVGLTGWGVCFEGCFSYNIIIGERSVRRKQILTEQNNY